MKYKKTRKTLIVALHSLNFGKCAARIQDIPGYCNFGPNIVLIQESTMLYINQKILVDFAIN